MFLIKHCWNHEEFELAKQSSEYTKHSKSSLLQTPKSLTTLPHRLPSTQAATNNMIQLTKTPF